MKQRVRIHSYHPESSGGTRRRCELRQESCSRCRLRLWSYYHGHPSGVGDPGGGLILNGSLWHGQQTATDPGLLECAKSGVSSSVHARSALPL